MNFVNKLPITARSRAMGWMPRSGKPRNLTPSMLGPFGASRGLRNTISSCGVFCVLGWIHLVTVTPASAQTTVVAKAPTVTFDSALYKVGYTAPASDIGKRTATVTVNPAADVSKITFDTTNAGDGAISVTPGQANTTTGVVTLTLYGSAASSSKTGDVTINAHIAGTAAPIATTKAVVLIPKDAGPHAATQTEQVTPKNVFLDSHTSPATDDPPMGFLYAFTTYDIWETVTVIDQFGDQLDSLYDGAVVTESGLPTNLTLQGGAYTDPVGSTLGPIKMAITDPRIATWAADTPLVIHGIAANPNGDGVQAEVGGHSLTPGVSKRSYSSAPPNTITIVWP